MGKIEYSTPKRKQRFFRIVKKILTLFYRRPKVYSLAGDIAEKSIIVANHCSKKGPVFYELYLPVYNVKWGAYQMLQNFNFRFHYLRDVYYIQKKGKNKFLATILATFEATFSKFFYKGLKFVGTYPDIRFKDTVKKSIEILDDNTSVLIFPENSNDGYFDVLTEFFSGFAFLAEQYYKKRGEDVPIYPVYFHSKKRVMLIGKPCFMHDYIDQGYTRDEIADIFKNKVNDLYFMIERGEYDKK